jgi:hypothetical protein
MDINKRRENIFEPYISYSRVQYAQAPHFEIICFLSMSASALGLLETSNEEVNECSQTSRLEITEELQLHHNHEKILFLTVLLLFAQYKGFLFGDDDEPRQLESQSSSS